MSQPFVAEVRMFACNFPPTGWAFCNGQILPISQNTALFSLLGTVYGGDGKSTFALPNLQGSSPMQPDWDGSGPGLSQHDLGEQAGVPYVTLLTSEMPAHNHIEQGSVTQPNQQSPISPDPNYSSASNQNKRYALGTSNNPNTTMNFQAVGIAGGSLPHNNMQPYLTVNFCIALQGVFPPRS